MDRSINTFQRQAPYETRNFTQPGALVSDGVQVGRGDSVFKADRNGIYLGNADFADAPFSVDLEGNAIFTSAVLTTRQATITPALDAGSTLRVTKADGTQVFDVDTTNGWVNIGPDQPLVEFDPQVSLYIVKDTNDYHAVDIFNTSDGEFASADFVACNNTDDPNFGFVDFGINGNNWNDPDYATFGPGAGFCWNVSGDMYFGTAHPTGSIYFFTGGVDSKDYVNAEINPEGVLIPKLFSSAPTYVKGGIYFDTTLNKLRVGGASDWETTTSA